MSRARPNILITGTPGSGKTTLCEVLAAATGMEHVNVGDVVRTEACHEGKDEEFDSYILDEDKLLGVLEPRLEQGNVMLDFHSCDVFPAELLDLVLVLRVSTENLFDRLTARGYHQRKINENMECEIMQVVLEDAREAFPAEMVHVVENNNVDEMEANGARVEQWLAA
mmetsp:Transcript_22224/g.68446  ORF Transcript_22224/g.68446 Transcript_22224/m.68446 type:complete len:168 (-) Transcript_22224:441-944(-)